ncbi:MAG: MBL fold metallo-hydrolase [Bacillota bacterium]|nr:MBL fold metallo-hydrolase [Bacillota bacterium]
MKVTVLGNNGPFQSAGGACSGYLLSEGDTKILIDCGNGVLGNLFKFTGMEQLDAIILTHLHSDHMSDMMVLKYAVDIKIKRGMMKKGIDVYAPSEPLEEYNRLNVNNVFNLKQVTENLNLRFENLNITFKEMKHPVKCFGVSIDTGKKRFVFSGDTAWTQNIIEFAGGCDVLMLDAGLLSSQKTDENVPHLTAKECGIVAREAGVKRLLLTHFWPEGNTTPHVAEARENFENTEATVLLATYEI